MLPLDECRKIIQAHVDEQNLATGVKLGLMGRIQEGEFCFGFHINSADMAYAGAGPTLVDRRNGKIIPMANSGCMENYEKRGDPYNGVSSLLHVTGTYNEGSHQEAVKYIRLVTEKSIAESRDIIDSISKGETFVFDTKTWRASDNLKYTDRFRELGFDVKRLTSFEARDATSCEDQHSQRDMK